MICNQSCTAVQDVIRYSSYGIDEEGPVPEHEDYEILVSQSPIFLSEEQLHHVTNVILAARNNDGIVSYLMAVDIINTFIN